MPNARLVWVEECGHVPHLEQPTKTAAEIVDFIKNGNPAKVIHRLSNVVQSPPENPTACADCDGGN